MNNKNTILLVLIMVIVVVAIIHFNSRIDNLQLSIAGQQQYLGLSKNTQQTFTTNINIEKVVGNGNVFGDNNNIENKLA